MDERLLTELSHEAHRLAALGLMACTGGNLSARLPGDPLRVAVSRSGIDKAELRETDFIAVDDTGQPLPPDTRKPSDECLLHLAIYRAGDCASVCHGHPPHAVALSLDAGTHLRFAGIEMQKAFAGVTNHAGECLLPVVDNSQDMAELAARSLAARRADMPAVLVRGHGVYAWGRSVRAAGLHLETVEWLCRILWLRKNA